MSENKNRRGRSVIVKVLIVILILIIVVPIVGVYILFDTPILAPSVPLWKWSSHFEHVPAPEDTEIIDKGYSEKNIELASRQRDSYGYYWVVKTELDEESLVAYFQTYIDTSNKWTFGNDTILEYRYLDVSEDTRFHSIYYFEDLNATIDALSNEEIAENDYYVIYAYKRGRWMIKN